MRTSFYSLFFFVVLLSGQIKPVEFGGKFDGASNASRDTQTAINSIKKDGVPQRKFPCLTEEDLLVLADAHIMCVQNDEGYFFDFAQLDASEEADFQQCGNQSSSRLKKMVPKEKAFNLPTWQLLGQYLLLSECLLNEVSGLSQDQQVAVSNVILAASKIEAKHSYDDFLFEFGSNRS